MGSARHGWVLCLASLATVQGLATQWHWPGISGPDVSSQTSVTVSCVLDRDLDLEDACDLMVLGPDAA